MSDYRGIHREQHALGATSLLIVTQALEGIKHNENESTRRRNSNAGLYRQGLALARGSILPETMPGLMALREEYRDKQPLGLWLLARFDSQTAVF
jgi:hypothetical protein